jgi:hypothetical protein
MDKATNNRQSRKVTDNTMDKATNNRQSRKVTDNTMDKTTNNDLGSLFVVLSIVFSVTFLD